MSLVKTIAIANTKDIRLFDIRSLVSNDFGSLLQFPNVDLRLPGLVGTEEDRK